MTMMFFTVSSWILDNQSGIMIMATNSSGVRKVSSKNDFFMTRVVYSLLIIIPILLIVSCPLTP